MENSKSSPLELTLKAIILGVVLAILLAAANAYIGLKVGMTVSASIPAAAFSMAILRLFKNSSILENNMVQTAASAGESLVAGIIFTIPALVMMNAWEKYEYFPMVVIGIVGGILGVAFTIPLRRALILEAKLTFPEGVATAEVLKSGDPDSSGTEVSTFKGLKILAQAAGIGAVIKACETGLGFVASGISGVFNLFGGSYLFKGNITLGPALLGVGYIVGINIACLVFLGGVIGTIIGVPLNWAVNSEAILTAVGLDANLAMTDIPSDKWVAIAGASWTNCRYIGVGAMMIGGLWSIIRLIKPLIQGIKSSLKAYSQLKSGNAGAIERTDQDTPINWVAIIIAVSSIPLFFVFYQVLVGIENRIFISLFMTVLMLIFGFIFSSVAGYMAGLVGSSNNPISGVTIATVIVSSLILLQFMGNDGLAGKLGPIAVIYLAGLICSAAAIAGDNMQDLKCGHLVGATPWRQQLFQIVGVVSAAFFIPLVLGLLDNAYGIGRPVPGAGSGEPLAAPQAGLMMAISTGIFGKGIEWTFIFLGFVLAVLIIILDLIQEKRGASFRFPVLAIAVGIYLPLGLSIPIFIGGVIAAILNKRIKTKTVSAITDIKQRGLLLASGLITGEALMGVLLAVFAAINIPFIPEMKIAPYTGIVAFVFVIIFLYKKTLSSGEKE